MNVPALGGLTAAVQYAASLTIVHPSGNSQDDFIVQDLPLTEVHLGTLGYLLLIGRDVLAACRFQMDGPALTFTLEY